MSDEGCWGRQAAYFRFGEVKQTQKSQEIRCGRQPYMTLGVSFLHDQDPVRTRATACDPRSMRRATLPIASNQTLHCNGSDRGSQFWRTITRIEADLISASVTTAERTSVLTLTTAQERPDPAPPTNLYSILTAMLPWA